MKPRLRIWKCKVCNRLYAIDLQSIKGGKTIVSDAPCKHHEMRIYNNYTFENQWIDEGASGI